MRKFSIDATKLSPLTMLNIKLGFGAMEESNREVPNQYKSDYI